MSEQPHEELARQLLGCAYADLTPVQRSVIDLIANETPSAVDPGLKHDARSFGERLADRVAAVGGSWGFIVAFAVILAAWMGWNQLTKGHALAFDPYPFIFLNLMLSMLAAIQAPVIMMRSEEHTSELQSLMRISYAVFCLKKKKTQQSTSHTQQ